MSDARHLLIPFAAAAAQGSRDALGTLALPHLARLLARLAPGDMDTGQEDSLSVPHERALARECGLSGPDGLLPWAAWTLAGSGRDPGPDGWAWITPCHWQVAADHILMHPPAQLGLEVDASRELMAAMAPYFEQDGLALEYDQPMRWRARGALFARLPCASLDRVAGRTLDSWLPRGPAARTLRRLQQEMQMLLYTHAATDRAVAERRLPVNSFWVSGAGALDARERGDSHVQSHDDLREPALRNDGAAWSAAWQALDTRFEALLAHLDAGHAVTLTLCGDRSARTYESQGAKSWRRITRLFSRSSSAAEILEPL